MIGYKIFHCHIVNAYILIISTQKHETRYVSINLGINMTINANPTEHLKYVCIVHYVISIYIHIHSLHLHGNVRVLNVVLLSIHITFLACFSAWL